MTWSRPRRVGARGLRAVGGRAARFAAVAGGALALSACAASAPTPAPTTSPDAPVPIPAPTSTGATATTRATVAPSRAAQTPAASPTGVATLAGGDGSARRLLVPTAALAAGWAQTQARETGGYRMTVCGVDLEPSSPVDGAQQRWQASATGPFVEQHVRVYADHTARDVVAALSKAVPGCTSYRAADAAGGASTYTVTQLPLPGVGTQTVAWRQRVTVPVPGTTASPSGPSASPAPSGSTSPSAAPPYVVQDVAVTKRGSSVVLVASYAVNAVPQADVLARAVKAIPGR